MVDFLDLKKLFNLNKEEIVEKVLEVTNSGWYILGEHTLKFEEDFSNSCEKIGEIAIANAAK